MTVGQVQDDGYRYLQYSSRSLRLPKDPFEPVNLADMPAYEHGVIGFYELKEQLDYPTTSYTWTSGESGDDLLLQCVRCYGRVPPGDLFLCFPCVTWLRYEDETHG